MTATPEAEGARPVQPEVTATVEAVPEQQVREYKEQMRQHITEAFAEAAEFVAEFNTHQEDAEAVQQIDVTGERASGNPLSEAPRTPRNREIQTQVWTQTTLDLLRPTPASQQFLDTLALDPASLGVINVMRDQFSTEDLQESTKGLSYVYKTLHRALNNQVTNPLEILSNEDFRNLSKINPPLHQKLATILIESARQQRIDRDVIRAFQETRQQEIPSRLMGSYTEQEFKNLFNDADPDSTRAMDFYEAIQYENVNQFMSYYQKKVSEKIGDPPRMTREEAEKAVTIDIHKTLEYIVNTIFSTTLAQPPEKDFDATARELGKYMADPIRVFDEELSGKLSRLVDKAERFHGRLPANLYAYKRESRKSYNPDTGRVEEVKVPVAELSRVEESSDFFESLRQIAVTEQKALKFQFNIGFLIQHPAAPDKGGVMGQIAQYAKTLETEAIDNLYILPNHELIQVAVIGLEQQYERLFSRNNWKKTEDLFKEVFKRMPRAEEKTLKQMMDNFLKRGYSAWEIRRAFYHGRLMAFGKEFMFHLLSSYADPNLTGEGQATYTGEGTFADNSVYDIAEQSKRWGDVADAYTVGLLMLPWNIHMKEFHPVPLKKEGEERWKECQDDGMMGFFDHKDFGKDGYNSIPLQAVHNYTRMGGVDGYGGWRTKFPYIQWLYGGEGETGLINKKNYGFQLDGTDQDALVKGWKSVENIGVNVLRNFHESFLKTPQAFAKNKTGEYEYLDKYESFFKFLYRRYFQDGVGQALYADIHSEQDYWKKIQQDIFSKNNKTLSAAMRIDLIEKHVYNAMTVTLYERHPLKFVDIEKKRSSQNGVTMRQELLKKFVEGKRGENGIWKRPGESEDFVIEEKFEAALDDIAYVEQVKRLEATEQIQTKLKQAQDKSKLGILFGDLNRDESEIDYKVNEESIRRILTERYEGELDAQEKIQRALEMYQTISEKVRIKPEEGGKEKKWQQSNRQMYNKARNHIDNRITWFSDVWRIGQFGRHFTADSAGEFMNRTAAGEGLISRTAEASQVISEATKNYLVGAGGMDSLLSGLSDAVRNGRGGWETLYKGIAQVYNSAKLEDKDHAKAITKDLINWALMGMRRDSSAETELAKIPFQIRREKTSIAAAKVDEGPAYDWDRRDRFDFVSLFTQKGILSQYTSEDDKRYKQVRPEENSLERLFHTVIGTEATPELMRDFEHEVSGEAVRAMNNASKKEIFIRHGLTAIGLVAVALMFMMMKKAMEEETKQ